MKTFENKTDYNFGPITVMAGNSWQLLGICTRMFQKRFRKNHKNFLLKSSEFGIELIE
jgi:hypothetical protein